jgi:hypothetical protein
MSKNEAMLNQRGLTLHIITAVLIAWPVFCSAQPSSKNEQHQNNTIANLRALPGVEERGHPDVIEFRNRAQGAVILMTRPSHPAHPAMVKHQSIEKDGQLFIETTSSSAGDPIALKKWIDHMAGEQKAAVERKRGAQLDAPADVD